MQILQEQNVDTYICIYVFICLLNIRIDSSNLETKTEGPVLQNWLDSSCTHTRATYQLETAVDKDYNGFEIKA